MDVVGKIRAPLFIRIATAERLGTILLCYGLAVLLGHVPAWLPMISACAVHSPEKYPFRLGLIVGATLSQIEILLAYCSRKGFGRSKLCLVSGSLACFGLGVVGAVNERENNAIHSGCAALFFLGFFLYMVVTCWHSVGKTSHVSLNSTILKIMCTLIVFIILIVAIILSFSKLDKHQVPVYAVCEWTATLCILLFQSTFASDLSDILLSDIKTTQLGADDDCTESEYEKILKTTTEECIQYKK